MLVAAKRSKSECGATLVETIFTVVMLLAITGGMIDIGVGLQRYGAISDSLTRSIRQLASTSCSTVTAGAGTLPEQRRATTPEPFSVLKKAQETVEAITGDASNLVSVRVLDSGFSCDASRFSPPVTPHGYPIVEVKAWVKLPCITCLFFGGLEVPVSTRVPVEDTSPSCGYPVSC